MIRWHVAMLGLGVVVASLTYRACDRGDTKSLRANCAAFGANTRSGDASETCSRCGSERPDSPGAAANTRYPRKTLGRRRSKTRGISALPPASSNSAEHSGPPRRRRGRQNGPGGGCSRTTSSSTTRNRRTTTTGSGPTSRPIATGDPPNDSPSTDSASSSDTTGTRRSTEPAAPSFSTPIAEARARPSVALRSTRGHSPTSSDGSPPKTRRSSCSLRVGSPTDPSRAPGARPPLGPFLISEAVSCANLSVTTRRSLAATDR